MNQRNSSTKLEFHAYFKQAGLSPDDFDPKYNKIWKKYEFGNYRISGPKGKSQPYFYPLGWTGYGLKVKGKHDDGNDNWLNQNNDQGEWCVMFYSATIDELKEIIYGGFRESETHINKNDYCLITKQKIGKGVYFSNHIEVCERNENIKSTKIGDQEYIAVLQVRVRPEALRQVKKRSDLLDKIFKHKKNNKHYDWSLDNMELWDNDYFVVNNTQDIRPYRILLKNIKNNQIIISQLPEKELIEPQQFLQIPEKLSKEKSSILKFKSETEFQGLFEQLKQNKQLVSPLKLQINQNIDVDNLEVLFFVLCDQMAQVGKLFNKSLVPNDRLMYSFHGQFAVDSNDSLAYTLTLQETLSLNYKQIASDEKMREQFINKCKNSLSIDLKVPENQIQIIAIEEGSIKVIFEIQDAAGVNHQSEYLEELSRQFPGAEPKLKVHKYFKEAALSENDFNPKYNMTWDHHKFGQCDNRGPKNRPQRYFFPVGWKGYALNVSGRYGENDNWLAMNGNDEEWYVMFHGTNFDGCKGIMDKQFILGDRQQYKNDSCLLTNKVIGNGVYFSNHIEVCEQYSIQQIKYSSQPTQIMDKKFIVAFQSRVRPEALRQCKKTADPALIQKIADQNWSSFYKKYVNIFGTWDNDYFVVNKTCDIRPYRILLKQKNEIQKNIN